VAGVKRAEHAAAAGRFDGMWGKGNASGLLVRFGVGRGGVIVSGVDLDRFQDDLLLLIRELRKSSE
jgi:hypothetical protein